MVAEIPFPLDKKSVFSLLLSPRSDCKPSDAIAKNKQKNLFNLNFEAKQKIFNQSNLPANVLADLNWTASVRCTRCRSHSSDTRPVNWHRPFVKLERIRHGIATVCGSFHSHQSIHLHRRCCFRRRHLHQYYHGMNSIRKYIPLKKILVQFLIAFN